MHAHLSSISLLQLPASRWPNYIVQRRRKIFEARVVRQKVDTPTGGLGGCMYAAPSPPDAEKTFKISHMKFLEILLL